MCRIVTMSLRISWANFPTNVRLGIAAMIFVAAGTVLLFVVNLVFAQRIIRAQHPHWGWNRAFDGFFRAVVVLIVVTLLMLIAVTIQSFYTLNENTHRIDRDIQLYGSTFYTVVAFLPIPLVVVGLVIPRHVRVDKFGNGRFRIKIGMLLTASFLLTLGAAWRTGTSFAPLAPRTQSPWYFHKAFFYVFDFTVEILVVYLYALVRVDRRFHVPNGARGPGSYSQVNLADPKREISEKRQTGQVVPPSHYNDYDQAHLPSTLRIYSEEELFDDSMTLAETLQYNSSSLELDRVSGRWLLKRQSQQSLYSGQSIRSTQRSMYSHPSQHSAASIYSPMNPYQTAIGSRSSDATHVYSDMNITRPPSVPAGGVKWETVSLPRSRAPSYTEKYDSEAASLAGDSISRYSYSAPIPPVPPSHAMAKEQMRPGSVGSRTKSPAYSSAAGGISAPRSRASEKSLKDLDLEKTHVLDAEYAASQGGHSRKSSWRSGLEKELRLSESNDDMTDDKRPFAEPRRSLTSEARRSLTSVREAYEEIEEDVPPVPRLPTPTQSEEERRRKEESDENWPLKNELE